MKISCVTVIFVLLSNIAFSQQVTSDYAEIYDNAVLSQNSSHFEQLLHRMYNVFLDKMTPEERSKFVGVRILCPNFGVFKTPFDLYSHFDGGKGTVIMSALSLKFFEDLSTAYAWLYTNHYSLETVDEYVTMLRVRRPKDFKGGRYPMPLAALYIPANALADSRVDDLSLRFRNEGFAFILAHELGHVYWRHGSKADKISDQESRSHEEQADDFAIELLRRTSTIPMGAILFFEATTYFFFPPRDSNSSQDDWNAHPDLHATHPLNAARLERIAVKLNEAAPDFSRWEKTEASKQNTIEVVRFIAAKLSVIAETLKNPEFFETMAKRMAKMDPAELAPKLISSNSER
jgi:sulfur carrier protein ThiS